MTAFAIAHPWMTLTVCVLALLLLENAIVNICRTILLAKKRGETK